jgi:hypothetical protein
VTEDITPVRFAKRVFFVEAVQVTAENMEKAAEWCGGKILMTRANPKKDYPASPYVKVDTYLPRNERQTRAFVDDWIVKADDKTWKTYPDRAFRLAFEMVRDNTYITK